MSVRAPILTATLLVDFADAIGRCTDITVSVALDGSVYAVGRRSKESARDTTDSESGVDRTIDHVIVRWCEGALETTMLRGELVPIHFAQPLSAGTLLVGARCEWRSAGPEQNALLVDAAGHVVRRMTLGDGIADVRTSSNDRIWVSYLDEGVFGSNGWAGPGPTPIGSSGLVCFDAEGGVLTRFDSAAARTDSICDAYATNLVGDDDVWVCFYTDFPIVRMHRGGYSVWPVGASGPSALAVSEKRVMLVGSYEHRARARVFELDAGGRARLSAEHELVDEDGTALDRARFLGVGSTLYAITGSTVRVVSDW